MVSVLERVDCTFIQTEEPAEYQIFPSSPPSTPVPRKSLILRLNKKFRNKRESPPFLSHLNGCNLEILSPFSRDTLLTQASSKKLRLKISSYHHSTIRHQRLIQLTGFSPRTTSQFSQFVVEKKRILFVRCLG